MERYKNKSYLNGLLLGIVMMTVTAYVCRVNASGTEASENGDNRDADCSEWKSCAACAVRTPCSWWLKKQRCDNTKHMTHNDAGLAVHNDTQCPSLKPVRNSAFGAGSTYTYRVSIKNDPDGLFAAFLADPRRQIRCCLETCTFNGRVTVDGREIVCPELILDSASTFLAVRTQAILYYFYVTIDGDVQLRFDDEVDYFFTTYENRDQCDDNDRANDDCAGCMWSADGLRRYAKWCAPDNPCTGARVTFMTRDAGDFKRIADDTDVVVHRQCKDVRVLSVHPLAAPSSAGGTEVRVIVRNHWVLATSGNRTVVVTAAGQPCERPVTVDKETIKCTTTSSSTAVNGPVEVAYVPSSPKDTTFRFRSAETFQFVDPEVMSVSPSCGPVGGGTMLSISGRHLNVGATVHVSVGDNVTCMVVGRRDPDVITCVTGPSSESTGMAPVRVQFDALSTRHRQPDTNDSGPWFAYTIDPVLAPGQQFCSIATGGTAVPVRGRHFSCAQNPQLYVDHAGARHFCPCHVRNDSYVVCTSPRLNVSAITSGSDVLPTPLHFGFQMDFNHHRFHVTPQPDFPSFHVYADPEFRDFETQNNTVVTINGRYLDGCCTGAADLTVRFGNGSAATDDCFVTLVQRDRIVCQSTLPDVVDDLDLIVVTIGDWFARTVPRKDRVYRNKLTTVAYVVMAISGTIMIVGVLLFLVLCSTVVRRSITKNHYKHDIKSDKSSE